MRVAIMGASGRVGTRLVELILANPGMDLAAALVSPGSRLIGTAVAGGGIEYRAPQTAIKTHCDVIIDFSTPLASLALQDALSDKAIPVIVGTTGFSSEQDAKLSHYSAHRPLLVSANFARGFEAFRLAATRFARRMPDADAAVSEIYHSRKKSEPSGTSRLIARQLYEERSRAMGFEAPHPPISVAREGDTVGINQVRFNMGSAEVVFNFQVHSLAAYAEGAVAAAQWLVSTPRPAGRYDLADSLNT
jgi:4-hydroxy-tetrahydrodipicolinate reductase